MNGKGSEPDRVARQKILDLLKEKSDTSRFVALALLKSVLETQASKTSKSEDQDSEGLVEIWRAISPTFLDRLLKAHTSQTIQRSEANDMVDIAVAVIHAFVLQIPDSIRNDEKLYGRAKVLIDALVDSSPETSTNILQILMTVSSTTAGAQEVLKINDLSAVIEIAPQHPEALEVLSYTWCNASTSPEQVTHVQESIDITVAYLLRLFRRSFKDTNPVHLLSSLGYTFERLPRDALPADPKWLSQLIALIREAVLQKPSPASRSAYTSLAASLLQLYPKKAAERLFSRPSSSEAGAKDDKPFAYLFVNLVLIDIKSSFPSLISYLNTLEYSSTSTRLASAFDICSSFISFLLSALDDEDEDDPDAPLLSPDHLLRIRASIAETLSLSIEFLRDRYDASTAGAPLLDATARSQTTPSSLGIERLTLAWESASSATTLPNDPLILAALRTLSLWLKEDSNSTLRKEATGLLDLFIELYLKSIEIYNTSNNESKKNEQSLDFRLPILTALEALLSARDEDDADTDAVERFLELNGWEALAADVKHIANLSQHSDHELTRGIDCIRVLLAVVDSEAITPPPESWIEMVKLAAGLKLQDSNSSSEKGAFLSWVYLSEFQVAVLQLAAALLGKCAPSKVKGLGRDVGAVVGFARQMERSLEDVDEGLREEALEVIRALEEMR